MTCEAPRVNTETRPGGPDARRHLGDPAKQPACPAALPRTASWASSMCHLHNRSKAVLDGLGRECLHDLARRLSLHHTDLAEDLALTSLGRRLRPGLEPAKAGQIEDACLGHLLGRQLGQAVDDAPC